MLNRSLLHILVAVVLATPIAICACTTDRAGRVGDSGRTGEPAGPSRTGNQPAANAKSATERRRPISRRRPSRHRTPELRPGDRPIHVELIPEGRLTACWINGRRLAELPAQRERITAILSRIELDPTHSVAVLDIHPRVPQQIVTDLVTDLTVSGIKRMVFATPSPKRREP